MNLNRLWPPLVLLLVWQAVSWGGIVPAFQLPSPAGILQGVIETARDGMPPGRLLHLHLFYSLQRVFYGYTAALVLAVPLGLLMGWSVRVRNLLEPTVELIRPIPPLAWIPIAILWFGIGIKSAAFIIFLGAFFPILLNTSAGAGGTDPILLEAAQTLNAKKSDVFLKVLLPSAAPSIFTGMRIGLGIGWMTLVAAEFTGVREGYGLGYLIMTARDIQRPDVIMAGMAVIGLVGWSIDEGLRTVERRLLRWR